MYLEFALDEIYYPTLELELQRWSKQNNINYHIKVIKKKAKITFPQDEDYTAFCLTWNPKKINYQKFQIIEPMKIDKKL
jgi:hypothetical protein